MSSINTHFLAYGTPVENHQTISGCTEKLPHLCSNTTSSLHVYLVSDKEFHGGANKFFVGKIPFTLIHFGLYFISCKKTSGQKLVQYAGEYKLNYGDVAARTSSAEPGGGGSPCILSVLSSLLERVVVGNERQSASAIQCLSPRKMEIFHSFRVPDISIEQYLERIFKYVHCSPSVFVVAYAYIDRLIQLNSGFRITSLNVHRLLITSVMVAAKFLDDLNYNNAYYAKVGGLTTKDINSLEVEFLFGLDFRLQVTVSVFESYCAHLEREVALGGGYQIERALQFICGMDEGSRKDDSQQQGLSVRCSYRGS